LVVWYRLSCKLSEGAGCIPPAFMDGWFEHDKWLLRNPWILSPSSKAPSVNYMDRYWWSQLGWKGCDSLFSRIRSGYGMWGPKNDLTNDRSKSRLEEKVIAVIPLIPLLLTATVFFLDDDWRWEQAKQQQVSQVSRISKRGNSTTVVGFLFFVFSMPHAASADWFEYAIARGPCFAPTDSRSKWPFSKRLRYCNNTETADDLRRQGGAFHYFSP
jgi:hypothetical protein